MRTQLENNTLTVYLEGRVDSNNAASVEGCELIGSGGYGKVYRIDAGNIAKIYLPSLNLAFVEQERDTSQRAFPIRSRLAW